MLQVLRLKTKILWKKKIHENENLKTKKKCVVFFYWDKHYFFPKICSLIRFLYLKQKSLKTFCVKNQTQTWHPLSSCGTTLCHTYCNGNSMMAEIFQISIKLISTVFTDFGWKNGMWYIMVVTYITHTYKRSFCSCCVRIFTCFCFCLFFSMILMYINWNWISLKLVLLNFYPN